MRIILSFLFFIITALNISAQTSSKRSLKPTDVYLIKHVDDPQVSPDGKWIAYTVSSVDTVKDKRNSDIWMVSWDHEQPVQLTNSEAGEYAPR